MKQLRLLLQLLPAAAVALTAVLGFQMSEPVLEAIVWPEAPDLSAYEVRLEEPQAPVLSALSAEEEQAQGTFTDGTFTGSGTGFSGVTKVEVVVEEQQITAVNILSFEDDASFFNRAKSVIDSVLLRQTWEVDTVSGATYSSRGILEAVKNALTGENDLSTPPASKSKKEKPKAQKYDEDAQWKDGTYTGSAKGFGGTVKVKVTISGGKIKSITVTDHSGETASYYNKAKAIIGRILKAQSPNVDTVSGATYSSTGIRNAVINALKKAQTDENKSEPQEETQPDEDPKEEEEKTPQIELHLAEGTPADGTYTGEAECERYGYLVKLSVAFKNGALSALKSCVMEDNLLEENVSFFNTAWKGMKGNLTAAGNEVDIVTGATYSSKAILSAYEDAWEQAVAAGKPDQPDESEESKQPDDSSEAPEEPEEPTYLLKDGTYTASAEVSPDEYEDFEAYTLTASVTYEKDTITAITVVHVEPDDSVNEWYSSSAAKKILKQKPATSEDVDVKTGATCSSKALRSIIADTRAQAQKAMEESK